MKNGDAFQSFIEETTAYLQGKTTLGYYRESLPGETDSKMEEVVARFMEAAPPQRETFQKSFAKPQRALFGIFSHRAATLAARNGSPEVLLKGVVAAAIVNYVIPDNRDVMIGLAVHHHCARKLDLDPADVFAQAAHYATPRMAELLIAFGKRDDINLRSFGWREIKTAEGIRYKFEF